MRDLQIASVSSESSGQSGSPSQSHASGIQVSSLRQWNSPTSHKMASKMAWRKSEEKEKKDAAWGDDHDQVDCVFNQKVCAGCTREHGWRETTWRKWIWWIGININETLLLHCTVCVGGLSFLNYNSSSEHEGIVCFLFLFFPPNKIKLPKPRWHRHCPSLVMLTASFLKDIMSCVPWKTITKQFPQVCFYLIASLVVCFHLMVGQEEFSESPVN